MYLYLLVFLEGDAERAYLLLAEGFELFFYLVRGAVVEVCLEQLFLFEEFLLLVGGFGGVELMAQQFYRLFCLKKLPSMYK